LTPRAARLCLNTYGQGNHKPSSMPATTADLSALKTEIIAAVKDSVLGLAIQETVSAVLETVAETKESVTALTGLMQEMLEELSATYEDVRYVRTTVTTLARNDAAHEAAIESLRKRLERVERKDGIAKQSDISYMELDFGHSGIDPLQIRQGRGDTVRKLGDVWWRGRHHEIAQPPMPLH
jgi:predicted RNase H-like nuclease (RuvC/YqgF family)